MSEDSSRHFVQSLRKGLEVIASFTEDHPRQTLSDVARRTGMTRASARRFLLTLVDLGYVDHDGTIFSLRPTVLQIGRSYLSMLTLPDIAEPHMRSLSEAVGEAVSLCLLDAEDAVIVAQQRPGRILSHQTYVGSRLPALASSPGRVLLAGLSDQELDEFVGAAKIRRLTPHTLTDRARIGEVIRGVRRTGYAVTDEEYRIGIRAIAMPIYQRPDSPAASLAVSVRSRRVSARMLVNDMLPKLQLTIHAIEGDLARQANRRQNPDPAGT